MNIAPPATADVAQSFNALVTSAQACRACAAMGGRRRVLSVANGSPTARIVFVAEAPGRRGGELTGVPLSRDASGQRFERLLAHAGLTRADVFITNAVLCNPQGPAGHNRPPRPPEVQTCSPWLARTLALLDPALVVTLGATALRALALIEAHPYRLRADIGRALPWQGRLLVPLYHPSPRAGLSRSYDQQDADFQALGALVRQRDLAPGDGGPPDA